MSEQRAFKRSFEAVDTDEDFVSDDTDDDEDSLFDHEEANAEGNIFKPLTILMYEDDLSDDDSNHMELDLEEKFPPLSPAAALDDPNHLATFPILHVSTKEINEFIHNCVLWSAHTIRNKDMIAQSTEILETPFVQKVTDQVRALIPPGFEVFNLFARLADNASKVLPHQDSPGFAWRYVVRFSTKPTDTSIDFHLSCGNSPDLFRHVPIPVNHGYRASWYVLSKIGVGLYHSVTPEIAIDSTVLQTSLIFDVRKTAAPAPIKFLQEIPNGSEMMPFGGKFVYLVEPGKRISAIASARGKIGGTFIHPHLYSLLTHTTLTHI